MILRYLDGIVYAIFISIVFLGLGMLLIEVDLDGKNTSSALLSSMK